MLIHDRGFPNALAALSFMLGAVLGFAVVGVLAFGGLTCHFDSDYGEAPLVWGSFHFLSVALAIGEAVLVTSMVESYALAWPLGGFLYASAYLFTAGAEATIAYKWDHRREK